MAAEQIDTAALRARIEEHIRAHDLIPPGGEVTCLVSGGADSTCLWHVLRELGYRVSALHVEPRPARRRVRRGRALLPRGSRRRGRRRAAARPTEDELRDAPLLASRRDRLRATGHTASDQVETVLYRLVSSGAPERDQAEARGRRRPPAARRSGARRRRPTAAPRASRSAATRSNAEHDARPDPRRDPAAAPPPPPGRRAEPPRASPTQRRVRSSLELLASRRPARRRVDLGGGAHGRARVRPRLARAAPVALEGRVRWGAWTIESELAGLEVRGWRPGDRLAGRTKKIQDVFVDAKMPRSEREAWPLVVRGRRGRRRARDRRGARRAG